MRKWSSEKSILYIVEFKLSLNNGYESVIFQKKNKYHFQFHSSSHKNITSISFEVNQTNFLYVT